MKATNFLVKWMLKEHSSYLQWYKLRFDFCNSYQIFSFSLFKKIFSFYMDFSLPSALPLLITFLLPFLSIAQIYSNITLGSSLTALDNNSFWASLSGDFAFGFQQIGGGGFLLAIWFNKVPEKTIIWSSNRNNVVQSGSKVQLTTDGLFVLTDSTGEQIWMADPAGNGVAVGEITGMKLQVNEEKATDMIERS